MLTVIHGVLKIRGIKEVGFADMGVWRLVVLKAMELNGVISRSLIYRTFMRVLRLGNCSIGLLEGAVRDE